MIGELNVHPIVRCHAASVVTKGRKCREMVTTVHSTAHAGGKIVAQGSHVVDT